MHLFKLLWQKRINIVVFILSLIIIGISLYPFVSIGVDGVFFSIDPDVVYTANALSYIKYKIIGYYDHPGIPSIYTLTQSLIPLRLYSKFVLRQGFMDFVFNNYSFVIYYLRIFQAFILFIGLNIFLRSIGRLTEKLPIVVLSFLLLINFYPVFNIGLSISAEALNFLLVSSWLYLMAVYLKDNRPIMLNILFLLTGLLVANRATNFFYVLASILIIAYERKFIIKKFLLIFLGFLIGILPSLDKFKDIVNRMIFFGSSSGVHGSGVGQYLNLESYVISIKTFWNRDLVFSLLVVITTLVLLAFRKKIKPILIYLTIASVITTFAFAKFPLQHYQIPNFLYLIFIFCYLIKDLNRYLIYFLAFILIYTAIPNIRNYQSTFVNEAEKVVSLEKFVRNNKSKYGEMWEWARSKNFAYLWTNSYGSSIFEDNLNRAHIKIYPGEKELFNTCWDKFYIQQSTYDTTQLSANKQLSVAKIPNSQNILLVTSRHCSSLQF